MFFYTGNYIISISFIVCFIITDNIDGKIARGTGTTSSFGGFCDAFLDLAIFPVLILLVMGLKTNMMFYSFLVISLMYMRWMSRRFSVDKPIKTKSKFKSILKSTIFLPPSQFKIEMFVLYFINPLWMFWYLIATQAFSFIYMVNISVKNCLDKDKKNK